LIAITQGSTFQKEEVGVQTPLSAPSSLQVLSNEGLSLKFSFKIYEWMEVEISSNWNFPSSTQGGKKPKVGAA
jgi:hypothetical protein